jgi:hypothetical protein
MGTCPSKPGQLDGVGIGPVIPANQGVNSKKNNSASKAIPSQLTGVGIGPVIPANKGVNAGPINTKNNSIRTMTPQNKEKRRENLNKLQDSEIMGITDVKVLEKYRKDIEDFIMSFEMSQDYQYSGGLRQEVANFKAKMEKIDKQIEDIKNGTIKEPSAPELLNTSVNKEKSNNKNAANNNPTNTKATNTKPTNSSMVGGKRRPSTNHNQKKNRRTQRKRKH